MKISKGGYKLTLPDKPWQINDIAVNKGVMKIYVLKRSFDDIMSMLNQGSLQGVPVFYGRKGRSIFLWPRASEDMEIEICYTILKKA